MDWARTIQWADLGTPGRWAKVNLDKLSPWDQTLFLDADTQTMIDYGDPKQLRDHSSQARVRQFLTRSATEVADLEEEGQ